MPQTGLLTFNELNGEEVRYILSNRFEQVMKGIPYFQRHLTLPRVKMTLNIELAIWADQPFPEIVPISDEVDVRITCEPSPAEVIRAKAVDAAAPIPGGHPPDKIREMHGLPISEPGPGDREVGGHMYTSDRYALENREVEDLPGLKISRTGSGVIDGMPTSTNATIAKIDQGPAGLRAGQMNRDAWHFGSKR
jgi:hypothetical protein